MLVKLIEVLSEEKQNEDKFTVDIVKEFKTSKPTAFLVSFIKNYFSTSPLTDKDPRRLIAKLKQSKAAKKNRINRNHGSSVGYQ